MDLSMVLGYSSEVGFPPELFTDVFQEQGGWTLYMLSELIMEFA
jgi:hypothetical protein